MKDFIKRVYYYNKAVRKLKDFIKLIYSNIFKYLFYFKRNELHLENVKSILFISLFFRGDVLYHTPLISMLRFLFPEALIDVWIKSRSVDVLNNNPFINEIIVFDDIKTAEYNEQTKLNLNGKYKLLSKIRKKRYDLIIDFTGLYSTALFVLFSKAKNSFGRNLQGFSFCYTRCDETNTFIFPGHLLNKYVNILKRGLSISDETFTSLLKNVPLKPVIFIDDNVKSLIDKEFLRRGYDQKKKLVTLHLGAGWDAKRWGIKNYEVLINKLIEDYYIAIIGDEKDRQLFEEMKVNIKSPSYGIAFDKMFFSLNFLASAEIIRRSSLFIGSDSGPLHLAFAVGTPSIGLFGPTNPEFSKPLGEIHEVIYKRIECSAPDGEQYCTRHAGRSCPNIVCMKLIEVDEVYKRCISKLENK